MSAGDVRVVSLVPSLSETCHWLGRGDDLVAVTDFCVTPRDGFPNAERVRGTKNPHVARIIELSPDVVLANREENRERDVVALRDAGLDVVVTYPRTVEDTAVTVRQIGAALGEEARASSLADDILATLAEVRSVDRQPLATLCPVWREPWMAVGEDCYVSDLLAVCGFTTVPRTGERYPRFELAEVRGHADAVLLPSEPYPFAPEHLADFDDRGVHVRLVDGELLTWHGPRTPTALRVFAALHDELTRQ